MLYDDILLGMVLSSSTLGITIFSNNSLLIDSVMLRNDTYTCTATNLADQSSRSSSLNVTGGNITFYIN